jgi:hypothetical protein
VDARCVDECQVLGDGATEGCSDHDGAVYIHFAQEPHQPRCLRPRIQRSSSPVAPAQTSEFDGNEPVVLREKAKESPEAQVGAARETMDEDDRGATPVLNPADPFAAQPGFVDSKLVSAPQGNAPTHAWIVRDP